MFTSFEIQHHTENMTTILRYVKIFTNIVFYLNFVAFHTKLFSLVI